MGFPSDVHGDSPATDLGKSRLRGQLRRELLLRLGGPGGLLGKMVEIDSIYIIMIIYYIVPFINNYSIN